MMFELLLEAMERACEIPTLNTPSPVAKRSFGGFEITNHTVPTGRLFGVALSRHFVPCSLDISRRLSRVKS